MSTKAKAAKTVTQFTAEALEAWKRDQTFDFAQQRIYDKPHRL